jgi:hypothetical protein
VLSIIRTTRPNHISNAHQRLAADLSELRSTILPRLQRIEHELASAKLDRLFAELNGATQLLAKEGLKAADAIERASHAMLAPLPRGKAGGIARAKSAWRYLNGTFMPESEKLELYRCEYERYAAGGRARTANARRALDGTFLRSEQF